MTPTETAEMKAARGALAEYDRSLAAGGMAAAYMPPMMAHLRAALSEVDRLRSALADVSRERDEARAQLAEAEAALANERGEGVPPNVGWAWCSPWGFWRREAGENTLTVGRHRVHANVDGWNWHAGAKDPLRASGLAPTARAAMLAADAAAKATKEGA